MHQKVVLITGCSAGGLGSALAEAFAKAGCKVYATLRDPSRVDPVLEHHESIDVLPLEVTSTASIDDCVAIFREKTGGQLDVLVNNAGMGLVMPVLDTSIDEAKRLFDVNVWGMLAVTQAFAPYLIESRGVILNMSSIAGAVQMAWQGVYNSSKAAMTFLSETLRMELASQHVQVITAMVGEVDTGFYRGTECSLPTKSPYKHIEEIIKKQSRGEFQTNNEKAGVTAAKLVKDVLGGRQGQVWHGGVAGTAKWASWLLPKSVFERLLHVGRGIY